MYTYFKTALNSLSSTTSKYKAFGTTTKTVATAQCLQNLQKYKKCLNSCIKKCLAIVCTAIVYKLHKTLTLHNPNTLYIVTKVSWLSLHLLPLPLPLPLQPQLAFSPLVLHFLALVASPLPLKAAPLVVGGLVGYKVLDFTC